MSDARFEDGAEAPLRLLARDAEDLKVISALVQDAVLTGADLRYSRARRRFSLLLNRFRWEDEGRARASGRRFERVRAVLDFSDVTAVSHQGLTRDAETVLSLLALEYMPDAEPEAGAPAGPGRVVLTFAGDGALALTVECLEVELSDVTRPYLAPSHHAPDHQA
ncbi:DUF2948 family protein [Pararhodobacter sp.]|uniref:DUF2948 family protein n=1 Tax=Pararhodobacter sp. TaxID=2127056 RepID=UPI002FE25EE8